MGSLHENAAIAQTQSEPTLMIINDRSVIGFDKSLQQSRRTYAYIIGVLLYALSSLPTRRTQSTQLIYSLYSYTNSIYISKKRAHGVYISFIEWGDKSKKKMSQFIGGTGNCRHVRDVSGPTMCAWTYSMVRSTLLAFGRTWGASTGKGVKRSRTNERVCSANLG